MIEFVRVKMIKNSKITRIKLERKENAREWLIIYECFASGNQLKTRRCHLLRDNKNLKNVRYRARIKQKTIEDALKSTPNTEISITENREGKRTVDSGRAATIIEYPILKIAEEAPKFITIQLRGFASLDAETDNFETVDEYHRSLGQRVS